MSSILVISPEETGFAGEAGEYACTEVPSCGEAEKYIEEKAPSLVIATTKVPLAPLAELFEKLSKTHVGVKRAVWAPYEELPQLVQRRVDRLSHRIIPRPIKQDALQRALRHLLMEGEEEAPDKERCLDWTEAVNLLQRTARDASAISNTAIRPFTTESHLVQMQIVLPSKPRRYEMFRSGLGVDWNGPLRPNTVQRWFGWGTHPVAAAIGQLFPGQELYVRELENDDYIYALLLPWQRKNRTTLVLGVLTENNTEDAQALMQTLHHMTLEEVSQFFVQLSEDVVQYATEYDWIVTENYVGPDRRAEPTGFINRHVFSGKRRTILPQLRGLSDWFVDRFDPITLTLFLLCMALSLSDTILTFLYVVKGTFAELNPVMALLIERGPWTFATGKTIFSVAIVWSLGRFQYVRLGRPALLVLTAGYLALNVYWLALLL